MDELMNEGQKKPVNISLVINVILGIAVIILYILHFTSKDDHAGVKAPSVPPLSGSSTIAFVNTDTILENYDLVKKLREELENEEKKKEDELVRLQGKFEEDAAYFQKQVQDGTISEESAQSIYAKLMQEQERLYNLREQYHSELREKDINLNQVLLDSITNFLNRFNAERKYDYILGFSAGGGILYAQDTFNITPSVLSGLNNEYDKKSGKKK